MEMEFEWDSRKRLANLLKHGLAFEDVSLVFAGRVVTAQDERRDYGEQRLRALGLLEGRPVVVIYTIRAGNARIISMRKANEKERHDYQKQLETLGRNDGR